MEAVAAARRVSCAAVLAAALALPGSSGAASRVVDAPVGASGAAIVPGRAGPGPSVALFLRPDALETIRSAGTDENLRVRNFPVDEAQSVDLELHRFEVFSPSARIVEADGAAEREVGLPDGVF
ncbi:MAG TPA: hypothetical protein VFL12_13935, partial [Thermoanaerobaculia bacterium]|nr:hypothetical protein [Thermoanaerobaculia bacterium]